MAPVPFRSATYHREGIQLGSMDVPAANVTLKGIEADFSAGMAFAATTGGFCKAAMVGGFLGGEGGEGRFGWVWLWLWL